MTKESLNNPGQNMASCEGLFDRIILEITKEEEMRSSKKLWFLFFSLLIVSVGALPITLSYAVRQWKSSGAFYFISSSFSNVNMFLDFWQDYILSIVESFPMLAIIPFAINIALLLFVVNLFLHKKGALLKILRNGK